VLFWEDLWFPEILSLKYPCLFTFVRNRRISVKEVMEVDDLDTLFNLPLSEQAYTQLQDLQIDLNTMPHNVDQTDTWVFIWGSHEYSSQKFYTLAFRNMQVPLIFSWLWKSKCTPRMKFLGWLMFVDRLNTRNMLRRRHFHLDDGYTCIMCNLGVEDINHLFIDCPFAKSYWFALQIHWIDEIDVNRRLAFARAQHNNNPFFMEIFLVAT
jgi:hypothetical protein